MRYALISLGLFGCVLPGVQLGTVDSGLSIDDTGVLNETDEPIETDEPGENEDTGEQDTDTEEPESLNLGLNEVRNQYLRFDGNVALQLRTKELSDIAGEEPEILNEFSMVLNPLRAWGFGVTLAPFDDETRDYLFSGDDIELLSGHGGMLTLSMTKVTGAEDKVSLLLRLWSIQEDSEGTLTVCGLREFDGPEDAFTPDLADLEQGFQMMMFHEKQDPNSSISKVTLHLQRTHDGETQRLELFNTVVDPSQVSSNCSNFEGYQQDRLIFGGQTLTSIEYPPGDEYTGLNVPVLLRARVDNLILLNSRYYGGLNTLESDKFHIDNLYNALLNNELHDADTNDGSVDGWGWWPFDLGVDHEQLYVVRDETLEMAQPGMSNWEMVRIPSYGLYDQNNDVKEFYYNGNQPEFQGQ